MSLAWSFTSPSVVFLDGTVHPFASADLYVDAEARPVVLQARAADSSVMTIPWSQVKAIVHA